MKNMKEKSLVRIARVSAGHTCAVRAWLPLFAGLLLAALGPRAHAEEHAHHHHQHAASAEQDGYARTAARYAIPEVDMLDVQGQPVPLRETLDDRPVILNFIYTTCGAVCPVMTNTFKQVQDALDGEKNGLRMVSISIDPEQDTPRALKAYADKYQAGPQWQMLTGRLDDSVAVQRAFDVYRGDKMNHRPATFLRAGGGEPWIRLDGYASAADIVREYRALLRN